MTTVNDPDRQRVYLCEDRLQRLAASGGMLVDGRFLSVEPDGRFGSLEEARLFCTLTCLELGLPMVEVRARAGDRASHYAPACGQLPAQIALASWGSSRLVVVHELAHHLACHEGGAGLGHGPAFRAAMLRLLRHLGLPRQARVLAGFHADAGLAASAGPQGQTGQHEPTGEE